MGEPTKDLPRQGLRKSRIRRGALLSSILVWLVIVGAGLSFLWSYETRPGAAASAPRHWPSGSRITPTSGKATLVMLAHPHCPCTLASLAELDKIMAHCQSRLDANVVLTKPAGVPDEWTKTDLWYKASSIPGVRVVDDQDGAEARRFDAQTSGQVLLYGANGVLLFSGGITSGRGHAGDNAGETAIESLVNRGSASTDQTVVFGCPLFNPESECRTNANEKLKN